ncbi:MAG: carbon starvation protein A [Bacteroidales bacterium]|nr:carbon starvation protein A [Bacteroidales bacterium]
MITFIISICLLVIGYFTYGKFLDLYFGASEKNVTPAISKEDGIDFKVLSPWRIFIIQFLNIAGLGPIFGAVLGAAYGPVAYIWIVIGCIFMGAAHDYMSGMLSIRNGGKSLPDIVGQFMGRNIKSVMVFFTGLLLLVVGASFVNGPAGLLASLTQTDMSLWLYVVFAYYIVATLLPIDKIIGKIYPFMGGALLFMALGIGIMLLVKGFSGEVNMIELTPETFRNYKSNASEYMLIPMLFVVISCGAISGFHATQSPMMARCLSNEKYGRPVFYGAMIAEGIVACIWATAAMAFFNGPDGLNAAAGDGLTPAIIVDKICNSWLGRFGAIIAIIGVIVCPITSGDTAFRSLRLILADALKYDQKPIKNRILLCIPLFIVAYILCKVNFSTLWTYVGIGNQFLATITLWTCATYFAKAKKAHWIMSVPATFLTFICVCFFLVAPVKEGGMDLNPIIGYITGAVTALATLSLFIIHTNRTSNRG